MAKRTVWILMIVVLYSMNVKAQSSLQLPKRQSVAKKTSLQVKVDGMLDDAAWKEAGYFTDFIEWRPTPGVLEDPSHKTDLYIVYTNSFIYVGGYCHEKSADSVATELAGRDKVGSNDFVGVIFDTYNDKVNGVGFYVTPLGEQYDAKYSNTGNEDGSWNAVWDSESKIVKDGWTFEMRIPYSALRFNSKANQTWGLNITRKRVKAGKQYMWNPVDPQIQGLLNQSGEWVGIEKIKPPLRLSFSPYFSTYLNHYHDNNPNVKDLTTSFNGGMDVKYGINQSFTLDMTLIPDFGQVQSDNQVLNLSPFEVQYNENRSFFTEGTELFSKGGLFYSRRIGSQPIHYWDVQDPNSSSGHINANEFFVKNPSETKLINATKVSGRNKDGLGIGIFNAITNTMFATVEDDAKHRRKIETNPLTNYNILVLDKTLKNNSYVSLVNTNVWRSGKDYDANVTAVAFDIYDKVNVYNGWGKVAVSNLMNVNGKNITGYSHSLSFGKVGGKFVWALTQELLDDKYDINDMGLMFNNNFMDHHLWIAYKWLKPKGYFNNFQLNFNAHHSLRYKPSDYQSSFVNINGNGQLKNLWQVGFYVNYNPRGYDFYEPRAYGKVFKTPQKLNGNIWFNSNGAKKNYYEVTLDGGLDDLRKGSYGTLWLMDRYRFNDKFSLSLSALMINQKNDVGFANPFYIGGYDDAFSRRDRKTTESILGIKYNFSKNSGITFRARHYWSEVINKEFFTLQPDGKLSRKNDFTKNVDQNYNAFTIDMVYTWQFAPGSFLNLVWKNGINKFDQAVAKGYFRNLNDVLGTSQNNNISLKLLYFLDYNTLRRKTS